MPAEMNTDMVNNPPHYRAGGLEAIEVAEDWGLMDDGYLFSAFRYVIRAGRKGDRLEDLRKAEWYLKRRIDHSDDFGNISLTAPKYAPVMVAEEFGLCANANNVLKSLWSHQPGLALTSLRDYIHEQEASA